MNFGDRKMQMSSEAVPAIRTSPISRDAPAQRLGHDLEADAARGLDEHDVARRHELRGSSAAASLGVGDRVRPRRRTRRASRRRSGPTVTSTSTPRSRRVARRSRGGSSRLAGPSSSMSPSTATRGRSARCVARSSRAARIDSGLAL